MNNHLTTAQLLEVMRTARSNWEALLAEVGEARLTEPGVEGDWSLKDIIAHITYFETWAADNVMAFRRGEPQAASGIQGAGDGRARMRASTNAFAPSRWPRSCRNHRRRFSAASRPCKDCAMKICTTQNLRAYPTPIGRCSISSKAIPSSTTTITARRCGRGSIGLPRAARKEPHQHDPSTGCAVALYAQ